MFSKTSRRPSVMQHSFSQVPKAEIPRSTFDRSHGYKTTFDAGYLVPVLLDEALPGDTFNVNLTALARLATPIFPIMDNLIMDTHFFAVPMRLIWDNWQKFCGEQTDPGDSTSFTIPQMVSTSSTGYAEASLHDYMGIPTKVAGLSHSSLWHRAYNLIWNSWYRDQNIQDSVVVDTDDGPDSPTDYVLLKRGKRHDYFTSCLPWPQKGDGVQIPLGTTAPIVGLVRTAYGGYTPNSVSETWYDQDGVAVTGTNEYFMGYRDDKPLNNIGLKASALNGNKMDVHADLTHATAATINSLRQAFQIQKIYERDARGGTRYIELVKSHFGVTSPDARLQRPEYLGGGSSPVNISPIPQTGGSGTGIDTPQGNLAAMGVAQFSGHGFTSSFTEHCLILGLVSVRADLTYQQGLNRMFSRLTRFDFYWPALAHIGEQAVLQKEIYADGNSSNDSTVFGYQERYAEYRYKPSQITGLFRSNATAPLDSWHLSQEFGSAPVLDESFIVENPPVDRCIAVATEPHFLFDSYIRMKCTRPMPTYGVPGLIDHF